MPISLGALTRNFLKTENYKGRGVMVYCTHNTMYLGRCELAKAVKNLLFINETVDMVNLDIVKGILENEAENYNLYPILVPLEYGQEQIPNVTAVRTILKARLEEFSTNPLFMTNKRLKSDFERYYKQYCNLLREVWKQEPNTELREFYKQIHNKQYMKQLKYIADKRKIRLLK